MSIEGRKQNHIGGGDMRLEWTGRFSAAHRLLWHEGKCKRLHGHTYTVNVVIEDQIDEKGLLIDFGKIGEIIQQLDHKTLLSGFDPLVDVLDKNEIVIMNPSPTSEVIALWIVREIRKQFNVRYVEVIVEESPGNRVREISLKSC